MKLKHVLVVLLLVVAVSAVAIGKIALPQKVSSVESGTNLDELCDGRRVGVGVGFQINMGEKVCADGVAIKLERIVAIADSSIPEHQAGGYRIDLAFTRGTASWVPNDAGAYEGVDPAVPWLYTVYSTDGEDWAEIVLGP